MRSFVCVISTFLLATGIVASALAATDTFTITNQVGSDTTPPTVPGSFTAIPISANQINLSWATSTDDFGFVGYHVWRDGVRIATTSLLAYSDVGLTASTTYTYYVIAYDISFNTSASSTELATTTLEIPPTPPVATTTEENTSRFGFRRQLQPLESLSIIPSQEEVRISFATPQFVRSTIRWGTSLEYELGTSYESAYTRAHETTITGLEPGTSYFFEIYGETTANQRGFLFEGNFKTMPRFEIHTPSNVSELRAWKDGDFTQFSWSNPIDPGFSYVRILENKNFYPIDPADGSVVFEGSGERARTSWPSGAARMYYTVFTYDEEGNVSSGAVVQVSGDTKGAPITPEVLPIDPKKNPIEFLLKDLEFYQEGTQLYPKDGKITIDGTKQLTLSIAYEKLPEHLKTILVRVDHPTLEGQSFTFLLRINKEKTAYTGTIAPFGYSGLFPITIGIFDLETQQIGTTQGTIVSEVRTPSVANDIFGGVLDIFTYLGQSYVWWILLLLILFILVGRRLVHSY